MTIELLGNKNYCASIVEITKIVPHSNADKLAKAIIFGNSVIVDKNTEIGTKGIFFPLETSISKDFLSANNLLRDKTQNRVKEIAGFFEENGRVRAVKLRGEKSEGFFIPIESLKPMLAGEYDERHFPVGLEFDTINGNTVCKKYVIPVRGSGLSNSPKDKKRVKPRESRLIENQVRLHIDTPQLKKSMDQIHPEDIISCTAKWHGTSWWAGNLLTKKKEGLIKSAVRKLFGFEPAMEYGLVYGSRKVVKNQYLETEKNNPNHFYGYDAWKEFADEVKDVIPEGFTLYGEAVGYLKDGGAIQSLGGKPYAYGCDPGKHQLLVYRITFTNTNGDCYDLTWSQIKEFCNKYDLKHVHEYYYGKAKDLYPILWSEQPNGAYYTVEGWRDAFLETLNNDKNLGMGDADCKWNPGLPSEGIVLKKETLFEDTVFKLKNWRFIKGEGEEMDKGETNIEDEQTTEEC